MRIASTCLHTPPIRSLSTLNLHPFILLCEKRKVCFQFEYFEFAPLLLTRSFPTIMNSTDLICSPSASGSCVALCSPDGVIKFYDTLTSALKLEYSSSTHLQAACTCLSWSKKRRTANVSAKSKKNKTTKNSSASSNLENELNDLDLIAIGTSQGSVLLYSLAKAAIHSELVRT